MKEIKRYRAYLCHMEDSGEIEVGSFSRLSAALVNARAACRDAGVSKWDWVVDRKAPDGSLINRRSSLAGLET